MKHTAVRWLEIVLIWDPISEEEFEHNINCWKQAKEMEKEQIMDAYEAGSHTVWSEDTWMLVEKQEYYNETFNNNEK